MLLFYNRNTKTIIDDGTIEIVDYESSNDPEKRAVVPCLTLVELDVVLNYIKEQFPEGWEIENGKVQSVGSVQDCPSCTSTRCLGKVLSKKDQPKIVKESSKEIIERLKFKLESISCLCAEGPEVSSALPLFDAIQKETQEAFQTLERLALF